MSERVSEETQVYYNCSYTIAAMELLIGQLSNRPINYSCELPIGFKSQDTCI